MFTLAAIFAGWEIVLILAVSLIVYGANRLPEITRGLGGGFSLFRKSVDELPNDLDQRAHDAGESLGGIYGKPAAQALTPDNQTAELYDPAAFRNPRDPKWMWSRGWVRLRRLIWRLLSKRLNLKV